MKKLFYIFIFFVLSLQGCSTTKIPVPLSGSKSDGTVTMAYQYDGLLENPKVDWDLTKVTAKSRCQAWGYKNAQAFGGQQTSCNRDNDCQVSIIYQCT